MFICQKCSSVSEPGVQPVRRVVETREKVYPTRYSRDSKEVIDEGGVGHEIVREMNLCPECSGDGA